MSPQNQGNTPKQPKKLKSLSSKPATGSLPSRVSEQVPLWLHDLLSKHGEVPGLLVGLEGSFGSQSAAASEGDVVSLLEQMGEEGIDEFATGPSATSVEWGQARSAVVEDDTNIDDFLFSINPSEDAETAGSTDWSSALSQSPQAETEAPDWLNEIIPSQDSSLGASQPGPAEFDDTPDWLTEALNEPVTYDETRPAVLDFNPGLPAQPGAGGVEVPDWLSSALDEPVAHKSGAAETPSTEQAGVDVPDWITQSITSAISDTPATEAQVPDWLSESAEPADSPIVDLDQVGDIPDWLRESAATELSGDTEAAVDLEVPDWLSESPPAEIEMPPLSSDEVIDFNELPDWLSADTQPAPSASAPAADELDLSDIPDWLSEEPVVPLQPTPDFAREETAIPDWLSGAPVEAEPTRPSDDWLSDLRFDPAENELAEGLDEALADPGDSLSGLDRLSGFGRQPAGETPARPSDTGWLRDLEPPPGSTEASAPTAASRAPETDPMHTGWLRDIDLPPGFETEIAESASPPDREPDNTDWLASLEEMADSAEAEEEQDAQSDWLSDLRQYSAGDEASDEASSDMPGDEASNLPDWLVEPEESEASVMAPAASTGANDWLSTFRRETEGSVEIIEDELPDWLSEEDEIEEPAAPEPATGVASPAFELPAWLTEEPAAEAGQSAEPAADLPDWMAADPDLPDWLSDSLDEEAKARPAGPTTAAELTQPSNTGAGLIDDIDDIIEEAELPDWLREDEEGSEAAWAGLGSIEPADRAEVELAESLADVPSDHAFGSDFPSFESDAGQAEGDLPSWLRDLPPVAPSEVSNLPSSSVLELDFGVVGENEEIEIPDWWGELSAPAEGPDQASIEPVLPEVEIHEPASSPSTPPDEEANEIPAWLSELQSTKQEIEDTDDVTADQILDTGEDFEIPDWLAGLSDSAEETAALAEHQDVSEFLAEVEAPKISLGNEAETNDWLSTLRAEADQAITEPALARETPLPVETDDVQWPDWFSDVADSTAPSAEEPVPTAAEDEAAEALEFPAWLSDLTPASEETPAETPAEAETPAWLSELRASSRQPDDEVLGAGAEVEVEADDTPDWFTAPAAEEPEPGRDPADLVIPDWLKAPAEPAAAEPAGPAEAQLDLEESLEALGGPVALSGLLARAVSDLDEESGPAETDMLDEQAEVAAPELNDLSDVSDLALPDWLSDSDENVLEWGDEIGAGESDLYHPEPEALNREQVAPHAGETPGADWMAGLRGTAADRPEPEADPAPEASESELDWGRAVAGAAATGAAVGAVDLAGRLFGPPTEDGDDSDLVESETLEVGLAESDESTAQTGQFELETPEMAADVSAPDEIPAWLADMPAVDEIAGLDTPDDDTPDEEFSFEVDDLDMPDWLADLPHIGEPADETMLNVPSLREEASPPSRTDSSELSIPDWLSDLPEIEDSHLAETESEAVLAETDSAATEIAGSRLDEPEIPDWFSEPSADSGETLTADSLIGDEPAWMAGLREATQGRLNPERFQESSVVEPFEVEVEDTPADIPLPDWLRETQMAEDEAIPTPDWLTEEDSGAEAEISPVESGEAETQFLPDWLQDDAEDLSSESALEMDLESFGASAPLPDWLQEVDLAEAETAAAEPVQAEPVTEADDIPTWLRETGESTESYQTMMSELAAEGFDLETALESESTPGPDLPDWLTDSQLENLEMPDWLVDSVDEERERPLGPPLVARRSGEAEPMSRLRESSADEPAETPSPDVESVLAGLFSDTPRNELTFESAAAPAEPTAKPAQPEIPVDEPADMERTSTWLHNFKLDERVEPEADSQVAESTGVLGGLGRLLPAERVSTPTAVPDEDWETAARQFQEVVNQPRRPAALPDTPKRKENFFIRLIRSLFQMLFIGVLALPLLPPLQKTVNGQSLPWTEPAGTFAGVLENQRREMLSEQLGLIDVQPPDAVALVSFDYSPASQGEMQPLAEAIVGRLKGQGMRLLAVSLDPEGPAMAQETIETVLAERGQEDRYGLDMVNLGYLPGQVAAVRNLAAGQGFARLTDFNSGTRLAEFERGDWQSIENISKVDLVITLADNPTTARWWVEQLELTPPLASGEKRPLLAATSATADPFLRPYRQSGQLDGLISGVNGAAAIEALRNNFGPARQMLDSQSLAHLIIIVLIALGTMVGFVPTVLPAEEETETEAPAELEEAPVTFESLRSRLNAEENEAGKRN